MDSTITPDPQPQQPVPQQQQQQQPHQQQPQQPPPPPQQHQQQQPQQPQSGSPYQPMPAYAPHNYYPRGFTPAPYPAHYQPYPHPPYAYAPPAWGSPASFPPASAQPISTPQPQSNVPQHQKQAPQIISQVQINSNTRTHQAAAPAPKPRPKVFATLKDPATKKEVPLPNTTTSSTKSIPSTNTNTNTTTNTTAATIAAPASSSAASTTAAADTKTTTATITTNSSSSELKPTSTASTTTTSNVEHVHKLLQKVSEDTNKNEEKPAKGTPNNATTTTGKAATNTAVTTTSNTAAARNAAPVSSASVSKPKTATTTSPSSESKPLTTATSSASNVEHVHKLLQKVSEETIKNEEKSAKATTTIVTTINPTTTEEADTNDVAAAAATTNSSTKASEEVVANSASTPVAATAATITNNNNNNNSSSSSDIKPSSTDTTTTSSVELQDGKEEKQEEQEDSKSATEALTYDPGQYNPITNRNGRRVYSRQFLLDVCEKICKLDLSHKGSDDKNDAVAFIGSEKIDMFAPAFAYSSNNQRYTPTNRQNEPSRKPNYVGRSSGGQEKQRKIIASASLTQEVELKTTANPWRPQKDVKETTTDAAENDEVQTESLKKKFRSILNKLTPNNFDNLSEAVTKLNIDTESKLGEVIDIVFAKALAEPGYCVLYGQMCSHLKRITAGQANFGNTLLKRCQHQFQSDIYSSLNLNERKEKIDKEEDPDIKKQLNEELYEDMFRCRMRGLGLIKFIGELYKIEMLNDKIMFDCVIRLLSDTSEESIECLCDLLTTIGEKLDTSSKKNNVDREKKTPKSASKANAYQGGQKSAAAVVASGSTSSQQQQKQLEQQQQLQPTTLTTLDQVFELLHKIRKNKDLPLSLRIRFKILDTCELREKDNWLSKKTKDNNPKKIEEIREAHKEKLEQERRQQSAMGPRRSQEGRKGLGHSGGSSNQISSLVNESGGQRGGGGQSNMHTSSSSHLLRDQSIGDNIKSNHNDIEAQKEHQKKLDCFKNLSFSLKNKSNLSSGEPLKPHSALYSSTTTSLRPQGSGGFRPQTGATAASNTTTTSLATASSEAEKKNI